MTAQAPSLPNPAPLISLTVDDADKARSPMKLAVQRFRRNRLAVTGFVIVIIFIVLATGAAVFSPFALEDTTGCQTAVNGTSCTTQGDAYQYAPPGTVDQATGKISI